jgi:hypothetical protein
MSLLTGESCSSGAPCGICTIRLPGPGLWLILGGGTAFSLVIWRLQPHKCVKHASHRFRRHARKLRPRRVLARPAMSDAQVDAIEDAWTDSPEQRHQTAVLETDRSHARR